MKKTELRQLIKEQIALMGYVDASMAKPPLSQKAIDSLMPKRKDVIKEAEKTTDDYFNIIQVKIDPKLDAILTLISNEVDKIEDIKIAKVVEEKIMKHIKQYLFS